MSDFNLGLVVNPVAGIGGAVGLKGSDGKTIQQKAFALGAERVAHSRTRTALAQLLPVKDKIELVAAPGAMGADVARSLGFEPVVMGRIGVGQTTADDTRRIVSQIADLEPQLILFAGGDGTARDIYQAIGTEQVVLGIPAGVKMHSAVFAINPGAAGNLAREFLEGMVSRTMEAEVLDLDEGLYRLGQVTARLFGYLQVPVASFYVQGSKVPTQRGEELQLMGIASWFVESMEAGCLYILGPGTTTRAIAQRLGIEKTLIGVDVIEDGELLVTDIGERQLLTLIKDRRSKVVISPIGGQGHLFGRGNQQISQAALRMVGKEGVIVVCTPSKLHSLHGMPLLIDSGDPALDDSLSGYIQVITGFRETAVYPVRC